jgi:DNA polymerase
MAEWKRQEMHPVRAYVEYFRDMGVHDFYRNGEAVTLTLEPEIAAVAEPVRTVSAARVAAPAAVSTVPERELEVPVATRLVSLTELIPDAGVRLPAEGKAAALEAIRAEIGDCTRCPLAYAGRHTIVFGDGDPNARLMFVGEGPGADEDQQGIPFVGKSGQLLNNMIAAMGLSRDRVYIANVVKCRPPGNRNPEPVEAGTCTPFLATQMDVVRPEVVVALGSIAATYLLGVKQSLVSLRGRWHTVRGVKTVVTYHPAFLLRDPNRKGDAWKDLQMVMAELGLKR